MLVSLTVQNYALIKKLRVEFTQGYSVITGETGAGKSILLGALGLVLGNRADLSNLKDANKKCVIEAEFEIESYQLQSVFETLELDYDSHTILRRELLPNGKSRAFVNDTPVNLKALQSLKECLLDIHSQHHTLELSGKNYQYEVVDALAGNTTILNAYQLSLKKYNKAEKELAVLKASLQDTAQQQEYNLHLYKELAAANLKELNEIALLELEIEKLSNSEAIQNSLLQSLQLLTEEQFGVQTQTNQLKRLLASIAPFDQQYQDLYQRIESIKIELEDVISEIERESDRAEANPEALEKLNNRLTLLLDLQKKHQVGTLEDLIAIQQSLAAKINQVEDAAELLQQSEKKVQLLYQETLVIAQKISKNRKAVLHTFKTELEAILKKLGMENAQFKVAMQPLKDFTEFGMDALTFKLASNKGSEFGLLKKVASGGELSRIMLAIKVILSKFVCLPTILFDEIDTGVSGEIATKMAEIMLSMGKNMQVITITHLPQVASKGQQHYKVYKQVEGAETVTYLTELNTKQRVEEIAEMLGGKEKSSSAIEHAEQLLSIS